MAVLAGVYVRNVGSIKAAERDDAEVKLNTSRSPQCDLINNGHSLVLVQQCSQVTLDPE